MYVHVIHNPGESREVWEPLYRLAVPASAFELELLQHPALQRLRHIRHYGAAALVCPVKHSRYDHTVGVWALAKTFFPDWRELHAAALMHDAGHLPFSHAFESKIGKDHHAQTERWIYSESITRILRKHGLSPDTITRLLNTDSPLSHRSEYLGIDHLDSFLRDTAAAGCFPDTPSTWIGRLGFEGCYLNAADEETAMKLIEAVVLDHRIFLNPYHVALDALLGEAVARWLGEEAGRIDEVVTMTDHRLLSELEQAPDPVVRSLVRVLLEEPHRLVLCDEGEADAYRAEVRKVYARQPLVDGQPFAARSPKAKALLGELDTMKGSFCFRIHDG